MNKYGIEKIEGESRKDYERRYNNEKMRVRRAAEKSLRTEPPKKRGKNKAPGKNGYLTIEQWEELKIKDGETPEDHKRRYFRETMRLHRARHGEEGRKQDRENAREHYLENNGTIRKRRKELNQIDPSKRKSWDKKYFDKNKEARIAKLKAWAANNPDRLQFSKKQWYKDNPEKNRFYSSNYRAALFKATPSWVDYDEIEKIYKETFDRSKSTGIAYEVDHFYPLRGKTVCGLHVHNNLHIITATENMKKRNHHPDDIEFKQL